MLSLLVLCVCITRHSDDMIEKLESAGVGFLIKGEETKKLGMLCYSICSGSEYVRIWTFVKDTVYVQVPPPCIIW